MYIQIGLNMRWPFSLVGPGTVEKMSRATCMGSQTIMTGPLTMMCENADKAILNEIGRYLSPLLTFIVVFNAPTSTFIVKSTWRPSLVYFLYCYEN